ncbi:MAG: hypothetical protein ACYCRF_08950, partial [Acidithiobacillus sp.]
MADQQNFQQEQERKAAENRAKIEALAREKVAERMREADQKRQQDYARQRQADDRKRAEEARKRDRQQQEMRAKAREHAKAKAAEALKKEAAKAKEREPEKQMHGASQGPTMRPSSGDKHRDALETMAEMDHPGLTDGQKSELQRQGVSMGEGFKNRETKRQEEAAARESRKTPADKLEDKMWFKAGLSYEKRQELEIKRDKFRVQQIEQGRNDVIMPKKEQVQVREPEKAQI